jgi:hypothetical protein
MYVLAEDITEHARMLGFPVHPAERPDVRVLLRCSECPSFEVCYRGKPNNQVEVEQVISDAAEHLNARHGGSDRG